jgi:hypothetical protein
MIQVAFGMDNDHLYSFFPCGEINTEPRIHHPHEDGRYPADKTTLGSMNLRDGHEILYWFDYGDDWMFGIYCNHTDISPKLVEHPSIQKSVGPNIQQYAWDDEDDEDYDEDDDEEYDDEDEDDEDE